MATAEDDSHPNEENRKAAGVDNPSGECVSPVFATGDGAGPESGSPGEEEEQGAAPAIDATGDGAGPESGSPGEEEEQGAAPAIDTDERPVVLVTNGDGIDAPGLRSLVEVLVQAGRCHVLVCAPDRERSSVGHSITITETLVVGPVDIKGATSYEVSGTPADCVSLSLGGELFPLKKPSLVISGINRGCNCGNNIIYSGTAAGAREGFIFGVPSIAISLNWIDGENDDNDFTSTAKVCLPLIHSALYDIQKDSYPKGFFLNIDVPTHPSKNKGYKVTRQGTSHASLRWRAVSTQRRLSGLIAGKEQAMSIQLAQLGLAASTAGAARRIHQDHNISEIETVAVGPLNGVSSWESMEKQYFQLEVQDLQIKEIEEDIDFTALEKGYIAVTPLGLTTHLELEAQTSAATWVSSLIDLTAVSML